MAGEAIQPAHRSAGVDVAPERIEAGQEALAILEPVHGDILGQLKILHAGAGRREGPVRGPQVAGLEPLRQAAQADKGRHVTVAAQPGYDRAERRMMGGQVDARVVACAGLDVRMLLARDDGADAGELVPHLRLQGEVLADLHAGDIGRDRLEFAAILDRGIRLEVIHVDVRRAARQVNQDGGLGSPWSGAAGAGALPEQLGEREARAEGADLEEVAPRQAVAEALLGTPDCEHGSSPCDRNGPAAVTTPILL